MRARTFVDRREISCRCRNEGAGSAALRGAALALLLGVVPLLPACSDDGGRGRVEKNAPVAEAEVSDIAEPSPDGGDPGAAPREEKPEAPRSRLTPAYLEGEWCVRLTDERSRYVFAGDGSYRAGVAGYRLEAEGTIEELLEDQEVVEVEPDRFTVTRGRGFSPKVFERGPCD